MNLKILKTGYYSFHPAYGPIEYFEENEDILDFDDKKSKQLIDDCWAKENLDEEIVIEQKTDAEKSLVNVLNNIAEKKKEEESAFNPRTKLIYLASNLETLKEKKQFLQDWAKLELNEVISKKNSVEKMIDLICELIENNS